MSKFTEEGMLDLSVMVKGRLRDFGNMAKEYSAKCADDSTVESMTNASLLKALLNIEKDAVRLKTDFDLSLLDKDLSEVSYLMGLVGEDCGEVRTLVKQVWELDAMEWVKTTVLYKKLMAEIEARDLTLFLEMLRLRA